MEHNAGPAVARELRHGCPDVWFPEVEAPDRRPTDAPQRATAAWDASVCARQDGAADAHPALLSLQPADGVGKWAGPARDVRERRASRHRLEHQAAPEVELASLEPYIPDAAPFGERSCAAPVVAEQMAEAQRVERSPIQPEALPRVEPPTETPLDASSERSLAQMQLATE